MTKTTEKSVVFLVARAKGQRAEGRVTENQVRYRRDTACRVRITTVLFLQLSYKFLKNVEVSAFLC